MGPLWPLIVIYIIHQMLLGEFKWELMFVCGFSLRFPCHSQTHSLPIATIGTLIPLEQWLKTAFLLPSLRTRGQSNFKINPWKKKKTPPVLAVSKGLAITSTSIPWKESSMIQLGPNKGPFFGEISPRMDLNSFCINLSRAVGAHSIFISRTRAHHRMLMPHSWRRQAFICQRSLATSPISIQLSQIVLGVS